MIQILFLRGISWWWKVEKHFPALFSGNTAQLMNFMGLSIFPFKWGGKSFPSPRFGKAEVVKTGTCTSTRMRHVTLKSPLLLQFPYCELCDNDSKQSNYRLMSVKFIKVWASSLPANFPYEKIRRHSELFSCIDKDNKFGRKVRCKGLNFL